MTKLLSLSPLLIIAACGQVASVTVLDNGGCISRTNNSTAKVQHFRTEDGDVVRCTIEFRKSQ